MWPVGVVQMNAETIIPNTPNAAAFYVTKEILRLLRMSRSSLYRSIADGTFPKPIKFGGKNGWLRSDVEQYLADRIAARGVMQ